MAPTPILFLTRSLDVGGAEIQLLSLARQMHRFDFEAQIVTFYGGHALEGEAEAAGIPVRSADKRGRWDLAPFALRLNALVREIRPAVLQSFLGPPNIFAALLKPFYPGLRVVWGVRASDVDLSLYDYSWRLTAGLEGLLSRFADAIVVNSDAGRKHAQANGLADDRMTVIPNGFDTAKFSPDPEARAGLRREWKIADDAILVGMVARLDPIKDHHGFLTAAARLIDDPALCFVCVGGGPEPYAAELRASAQQLGLAERIIWAGERNDMAAVYNAFDLVVLNSISEGFPNAVGEAMAVGIPCVVTNVGDCANLVADSGLVVPPRDPEALAEAIRQIALSGGEELSLCGRRARQRIVDNFSIEVMAGRAAEVYRSLLAGPPVGGAGRR